MNMEIIEGVTKRNGNSILNNAKYSSSNTDEWYTTYETIADELQHYKTQFKGKTVLCNCDDPFESNFTYYFLRHFNQLQLKKLICTSFAGSKIDQIHDNCPVQLKLFDEDNEELSVGQGYVLIVSKMPGEATAEIDDDTIKSVLDKKGVVKKLKGSGDFRSEECISYLKECDICCIYILLGNVHSLKSDNEILDTDVGIIYLFN